MGLAVNIGGSWKDMDKGYVNINGVWKEIDKIFCNIGGVWKEGYIGDRYSSFSPTLWVTAFDSTANKVRYILVNTDTGNVILSVYYTTTQSAYSTYIMGNNYLYSTKVSPIDGTLYFYFGTANKIIKITTDGIITEYTIPNTDSFAGFEIDFSNSLMYIAGLTTLYKYNLLSMTLIGSSSLVWNNEGKRIMLNSDCTRIYLAGSYYDEGETYYYGGIFNTSNLQLMSNDIAVAASVNVEKDNTYAFMYSSGAIYQHTLGSSGNATLRFNFDPSANVGYSEVVFNNTYRFATAYYNGYLRLYKFNLAFTLIEIIPINTPTIAIGAYRMYANDNFVWVVYGMDSFIYCCKIALATSSIVYNKTITTNNNIIRRADFNIKSWNI